MKNNKAIIEQIDKLEQCARKPENKWVLEELEKRFGHTDCRESFSKTTLHNEGADISDKDENVRNNTDLLVLLSREMTLLEQKEFEKLNKQDKRRLQSYLREKKSFLARMIKEPDDNGNTSIWYKQYTCKKEDEDKNTPYYNRIRIIIKHLDATFGKNTNKTLLDTIKEGPINEILHFNSRTEGVLRVVEKFLKELPYTADYESGTVEEVESRVKKLQDDLSRYLYFTADGREWHYELNVVPGDAGVINEERAFNLTLANNEGEQILLTTFVKTDNAEDIAGGIITNLVVDNNDWRRNAEGNPIVKWQVDYGDVDKMKQGNKQATLNISELIDDGVFEMPVTRLSYKNETAVLQSPSMDREGESMLWHPAETNQNETSSMIPIGQTVVVGDEKEAEMCSDNKGEHIVNIVSTMSKDISFIRSALGIRANASINYGFIGNQRLRDQLIIDNLRMENAALDLQEKEINRFYAFCVNAFYQVENIINYYFYVTYPNIDDLLSTLENATINDGENGQFQFKRSKDKTEKNVGDISIFFKINAFCNLLFPKEMGLRLTLGNLRQVRNEGEHRCQVLYSQKDEKNKLFDFLEKATFNSVRATLIKVVNTIKEQDEKRIELENAIVDVTGSIAKKLQSACFVSYVGGSQQLPEMLCKKVKKLNEGDKVTLKMKKGKIIDIVAT